MYPDPNVGPLWEIPQKALYSWVFMGYNPQESLENTINTVGTLLGVRGTPNRKNITVVKMGIFPK